MSHIFEPGTAPFPGCCLICGTNRRPCIDFPVTQAFNGAMLVCTECFFSIAWEHGKLLDLTKASTALEEINALEDKIIYLQRNQNSANQAIVKLQKDITDAVDNFDSAFKRPDPDVASADAFAKLFDA